jgi:hypothetical protein
MSLPVGRPHGQTAAKPFFAASCSFLQKAARDSRVVLPCKPRDVNAPLPTNTTTKHTQTGTCRPTGRPELVLRFSWHERLAHEDTGWKPVLHRKRDDTISQIHRARARLPRRLKKGPTCDTTPS